MKVDMHQWVKSVMSGNRKALPIMTHPGIELIGKSVLDVVTDGEAHFRAIEAIQHKFNSLAATMVMDLTVEAQAFGSSVNFSENEVPTVTGRIVNDFESVTKLEIPALTKGRVPEYLKAAKLAADNICNVPVFAGCIGPFSLAGRLFDMTEIMTAAFIEPETVELLLSKCTQFLTEYIRAFKNCGVNGILIAEPAAGMLSEEMCQQLSSDYIKKIVAELQDEHFMIILHNCGNTGHVTQSMVSSGAAGLHFGNKIDMEQVLKDVTSDILVFGNLDPVSVFKMGNAQSIHDATIELLKKTEGYSNFVISSGCDTPPGVEIENITAFFDAVNKFNESKTA